ncbi:MAG: divergent polysaccharide deacetylase family protein [Anderseniella sp.]|nr:divergent polysaccharide deacetylase family protein [Anderseniella sp.]
MENDLRQPLKRRSLSARLLSARPSALRATSLACITLLGGLAGWLVVSHEPHGGEPVVHMRIDTSDPIITSSVKKPAAKSQTSAEADSEEMSQDTGADTPVIDLSELGSRNESDLDRRRQQLANGSTSLRDVESPAGALSIDDLAPSRTQQALIPSRASLALVPAPVAKITGKGPHGPLPRRAKDGSSPSTIYARPLSREQLASDMPKIALLIGGMGLNEGLTRTAINRLPPEVSLGFAPYGENLQQQANDARSRGHELYIHLPMEPFGYPSIDPGPYTLLTSVPAQKNLDSLHWHLSRFAGYAGVTNYLGAQFASNNDAISPVLKELGKRGLIYVDDGSKGLSRATQLAGILGLNARSAVVSLDGDGTPASVLAALQKLEAQARHSGIAIATGSGLPATIEAIEQWAQGLAGRNILLVPVSAAFVARRS